MYSATTAARTAIDNVNTFPVIDDTGNVYEGYVFIRSSSIVVSYKAQQGPKAIKQYAFADGSKYVRLPSWRGTFNVSISSIEMQVSKLAKQTVQDVLNDSQASAADDFKWDWVLTQFDKKAVAPVQKVVRVQFFAKTKTEVVAALQAELKSADPSMGFKLLKVAESFNIQTKIVLEH